MQIDSVQIRFISACEAQLLVGSSKKKKKKNRADKWLTDGVIG